MGLISNNIFYWLYTLWEKKKKSPAFLFANQITSFLPTTGYQFIIINQGYRQLDTAI
jgi:hypothetical protein